MGRDQTRRRHGRHRSFDRLRRGDDSLGFLDEQQVRLDTAEAEEGIHDSMHLVQGEDESFTFEDVQEATDPSDIGLSSSFLAQAQSIDFDGATEKMESVAALLGIANVFTLGGWVKPNSLGVSGTLGGFVPSTSTPNAVGLYHRHVGPTGPNAIQLIITDSGGLIVQNVSWPNVLSGGVKWYHVLVQWAGTTASRKLFVDGVDQGAPSFTQTNTAGTLTDTSRIVLFGGAASGVPAFAGRQAAWQAWDKILGTLEITDVYNTGSIAFNLGEDSGNYASAADLQHWWELGKNVSPNLGQDSGVATAIDVEAAAVGITDADRVVDVPT